MEQLKILEPGLCFTVHAEVTLERLALSVGSGDLPVLATPAMLAQMECAAMKAVDSVLPEGSTTVGSEILSTHLCPTPLGAAFSATARLVHVEGRRLEFEVEAHDAQGSLLGSGTHVRYVVDRERFLAKMVQ